MKDIKQIEKILFKEEEPSEMLPLDKIIFDDPQYGDMNPNHQSPFTYENYVDRGWANSGVAHCTCNRANKEQVDNGLYLYRGKDTITICHECQTFIHTDMGD